MSIRPFTKEHLVQVLVAQKNLNSSDARSLLEIKLEEIKHALETGQEVKITGFGKWKVLDKRSRKGRNPHTGEFIEVSARKVVTFSPSDKLRSTVSK